MGNQLSFNKNNTGWQECYPRDTLKFYSSLLGAPSIIDLRAGGFAVWNSNQLKKLTIIGKQSCLFEIIIRDESIKHYNPNPHSDCVYVAIKLEIMPLKLNEILILSDSLSYDQSKKLLWSRCSSIENNIAILKIATDILIGSSTLGSARKNLSLALKQTNDKSGFTSLYNELCSNVSEYNSLTAAKVKIASDDIPSNEHMIVHNKPRTSHGKNQESFYVRCPSCGTPQTCLRGTWKKCGCGFLIIERYEGMPLACKSVMRQPNDSLFDSMNPELHTAAVNDKESIVLKPEVYGDRADELNFHGSTTEHPQWLFGENSRVNGTRIYHNIWAGNEGNRVPLAIRLKQANITESKYW